MGRFVKGDVVVVAFPFSDLSSSKRRPALVIANASENDMVLAQITSLSFHDSFAIGIDSNDFDSGGLRVPSNIRANKLFTADTGIILYKAGSLKPEKTKEVIDVIISLVLKE